MPVQTVPGSGCHMLNDLVKEIHETAVSKGWWDEPRSPLEIHALIHSEIAEATESVRNGEEPFFFHKPSLVSVDNRKKPEGQTVELVDAVIRILDFFGHNGWNFDEIKDILENTVGDVGYKSAVESIKSPLEFHAFVHAIIASASHEFITTGGNEDGEHYLVRVVDVIRRYFVTNGWDFEEILKAKMEYNKTRPYRHGGKKY